ncbi:hypothetical protein NQ314_006146 [Rhamnusium bicolor]|uniref:Aminopeptidase n=1 Tax=Rhamnusium bicolor TaxID=1586634 RepID=A0AAV8Z7N4_9CUCU|nr:hypothetical protein NQ314_006146 [Rhamnusium bicolor]
MRGLSLEGMATVLPDWELKKQFVVLVLQPILDTDSYLTAQALQSEASTPSEIDGKFGSITYNKGASILRMVENTLGEENFRNGLRNYLRQYEFSSTVPNDLWNVLSSSVNQSVSDLPANLRVVLQNWVESSGYPPSHNTTSKWYVPVTLTTSVDDNKFTTTTPEGWLTPTSDLTITLPQGADWVILNNQQAGYYRINYELSLWDKIATALSRPNFSEIPDINRAAIVDDVFNLAKVEKVLYSKAFEIIDFLRNDVSYFSWYPTFNGFNYLFRRVGKESELGQAIVTHLSDLMENLYRSVPLSHLDESDQLYTLKQVSTVNWACWLGKQECVTSVLEIFRQYKENSVRLLQSQQNLRSIVYCNGLRYSSDSSDWEFLWQKYLSTNVPTERSVLISALGCTNDVYLLNRYLLKTINSSSGITAQDAYAVFAAVYEGNYVGIDVAFRFLLQYHQAISDHYQSMNALANLLNGIATRLTTQEQVTRVSVLLAVETVNFSNLSESFREAATQALETAKTNLAWIDQFRDDLHLYYGIEEEQDEDDFDDSIDINESTLPEFRLSRNFRPFHYEIHLIVPHEAFTPSGTNFTGTAVIHFNVHRATNEIRLHASAENIDVQSIQLNGAFLSTDNYSVNSTTDILTISLENDLEAGTLYMARFQYNGIFGSNNRGFYKSSYLDAEGIRRYLVTTQFEPPHARRAFPCFDEPQYKATFQILITHPIDLIATSNTIGSTVQSDLPNNLTTTQFRLTPITASYLIAFVVSDFTCTSGEPIGEVPYEVCSRDNARENRAFAVEVGPKLLASLNNFTGYDYGNAMEKMDQFAIPDFAAGAMENWGLVTYREPYLLWDPLVSTNILKQSIATVIAHEFAHMWFGNLVTCQWWSEIFLNEGFATYFEFFTTHDVCGSVIRMVEHFMGLENFRAGLQHYLHTHQFGNTKPEDLWEALALHVNNSISRLPTDLESIMENWIKSSGFPLLYERFLVTGQDISSRWYVPITFTTSVDDNKFGSTLPSGWLVPGSNLRIPYPTGAQWVILNNHETAFYRVNYANNLWDAIAVALSSANFSGIPELNRAQIADDLFNFVRKDLVPYSRVLRTLEFLENDTSFFTWYPTYNELNTFFSRVGLHTHLGNAVRQSLAITLACRVGNENCAQHARELFAIYRTNGRHSSNRSDWDFLWDTYRITTNSEDRSILVTALGCTTDPVLLREYLSRAIDRESGIVISDSSSIFSSVYAHHTGHGVAFQFVIENHSALYNYFQNLNAVGNIIRGIAGRFTTPEELAELVAFVESGELEPDLLPAGRAAIETAEANVRWVETYQEDLHDYYEIEPITTTTTTTTTSTTTTTEAPTTPDGAAEISSSIILTIILVFVNKYLG